MSNEFKTFADILSAEKLEVEAAPMTEDPVIMGPVSVEEEEPVEEVVEEEPAEEDVEEEPVETTEEKIMEELSLITGVVIDCKYLNVRSKADKKSESVAIIPVGTEVKIDLDNSKGGWYAVITEYGDIGYCMKNYIAVV